VREESDSMAFPGFANRSGRKGARRWLARGVVVLALASHAEVALAGRYTWDVSAASGYQAGSGIWNADSHWSTDGVDRNTWPGPGHVAVFAANGTALGIQVNGTVATDSILFTGTGYTVAGGTIQMSGAKPIVATEADATLQSAVSGAWTKTGSKRLVLSGNNLGTTSYTHAGGATFVNSNTAFGTGPVVVEGPGRLILAAGIEMSNGATISSCSPGAPHGVLSPDSGFGATWSGPLDVNADCATGGVLAGSNAATGSLQISGPIRMGGTATRVRQQGGTVVYRGGGTARAFELAGGTARLGAKNGLPPTAGWSQPAAADTSTLELEGFDQTFLFLHSPAGAPARIANTKDWIANLSLTGSVDTTYGGAITGRIALDKSGQGQQTLSGVNTYTGPTRIGAGTLSLTGSLSAQSAVTVDSGATLRGTGTAAGSITAAGGTIAPGLNGSIGSLKAGSADLSSAKASTLRIRIAGTDKPGIRYDRLELAGNLVLGGGSVLELDLSGLSETGTATGIATAAGVTGLFDTVILRNLPKDFAVNLEYKSALVNAVVSRTDSTPPSFAKGSSQNSIEDGGARSVSAWATSIVAGSGQTPGFRVSTDRPGLFSAGPSISSTGTLAWTSAPDSNGTAVVRIRMGASGHPDSSAIDSFTITVAAVNDRPTFAKGAKQVALAGAGEITVPAWATAISAGPPDESGQKLAFRIVPSRPALYLRRPTLSAEGTLHYQPSAATGGIDTLFVRLGDDGGTANGGLDSSAIDTFVIEIRPPPVFRIRPDTLKLRTGESGRFAAFARAFDGSDSAVSGGALAWSWSVALGTLDTGRVAATRTGTSRIVAQGFGMADTAWLVVADPDTSTTLPGGSELDTTLAPSTDSVTLAAGRGVAVVVPPHAGTVRVAVSIVDSPLVGVGVAAADSAIVVRSSAPDSLVVKAPASLVAAKLRSDLGNPSVFRMDSTGSVHLVPSTAGDSTIVFRAAGVQAYWLGYDTLAPVVAATLGSDSISTKPVVIGWRLRDNVAETGIWLCLLEAGRAVPRCSLLARSDSASGSLSLAKASLPLGGMVWLEGRDSRDTTRTPRRDVVVKLDTIRSPWKRTEDRYEMLALPYVAGRGSAHQVFSTLWGNDDDRTWRAFGAAGGAFVEILSGEPMDAKGRGFWARTRGTDLRIWSLGYWTTPMSKPVAIRLEPGWNAVGNPYGFDVPWSEVFALSGLDSSLLVGPYGFDAANQGWTIPDTARIWPAWKGAALFHAGKTPVDLLVPSLAADAAGKRRLPPFTAARASTPDAGFRVSVAASQPGDTAPKVWIGLATVGRAFPMPPLPVSGLRAALLEPGRGNLPFLSVARTPHDTNTTWTLRVAGLVPGVPLVLDVDRSDADTAREVWLHDDKSGRWLPATGRLEIATGSEELRTFALRIGPAPAGSAVPRNFGFENRGPLVAWSLPDDMGRVRVRIDAYDLRGCLLENVVDELLDPGTYARALEVRSPIHQYLLVLRAGGRRQTLLRFWRR
jgi:autotransporter-associated beta strand protein